MCIKYLSVERGEGEKKERTESEIFVQHTTFLQMLYFPSHFIMAYAFVLLITELYLNIFLSESGIQAIKHYYFLVF